MKVISWGIFSADGVLQKIRPTEAEAQNYCGHHNAMTFKPHDAQPYTVKPLIVAPDNLMSHKNAWLDALEHLKNSAALDADLSYWQHELNAMQAMYKELEK